MQCVKMSYSDMTHAALILHLYHSAHSSVRCLSIPVAPTWSIGGIREMLVSLQFLNLRQSVGLLGREMSPSQGRYLQTGAE
jgi:hypothetical protein